MNDTIISTRQKCILNLISRGNGLLRSQIQEELEKIDKISKVTLIRDLNILLKNQLIKTKGNARSTLYLPYTQNPILRYFDLEVYFQQDPDKRSVVAKHFDFSIFSSLNHLITPIELKELKDKSRSFTKQTEKLSSDILKRELERFVIELSWKSSKIEGNTYSLLETEALIKEQKEAKGKSKEETVMILNHKSAFDQILNNKKDFTNLTVFKINQLHNFLVKDMNISTGIRKNAVGITGTVYRPLDNQHQIREAVDRLIKIINNLASPFEKALIAHFMIPYIQPYADGNKRLGRMLTNAIFLAYDLYPLSYRSVDEDDFKKALILMYEQKSIYHIKRIFIEQIHFAHENYFK